MRRADRLFRIVQMLRSGRLKTARGLAERLQVSERTIYRDVRDLQLAGQPIEGEAGVGYTLRRDFDLPPLMFTPDELTALVLGARLVEAWGGAESVIAAKSALARIEAVLRYFTPDRPAVLVKTGKTSYEILTKYDVLTAVSNASENRA